MALAAPPRRRLPEDLPAGGQAVHGLLEAEQAAIVALHDDWAEIDRSHR